VANCQSCPQTRPNGTCRWRIAHRRRSHA
jgi:hypothetical protein